MREGREGGIESDRDSDMEIDRLEKLPLLQFSTLSDGFDVCEADGPFINPSRSQALGSARTLRQAPCGSSKCYQWTGLSYKSRGRSGD